MSGWRILIMAHKELLHIVRDMRTVYMALGVPLVLLLLFGYALTMDVENVRLVVVDQDRTRASRDLTGAFDHAATFVITERTSDPREILEIFHRGEARAALVIPRGYGRALDRGEEAAVQLVADGTNANDASIALGFGAAVGQAMSLRLTNDALARLGLAKADAIRPPLEVKTRNWFNQDLKSQWYMVPGLIAVILAMITTILTALTVAREWERGTMEQLLVTPVRRIEIVLGKLIPYYVIGLGQLVLIATAGILLFGVPLRGSIPLLVATSSLFIVAGLGQGLLISVLTRNQQVAMQISMISSMLPSLLLSGFMSPIASMPRIIQWLTYAIPSRYFLVITRGIFLKGTPIGAIAIETAAVAAFGVILIALSVAKFRTRVE